MNSPFLYQLSCWIVLFYCGFDCYINLFPFHRQIEEEANAYNCFATRSKKQRKRRLYIRIRAGSNKTAQEQAYNEEESSVSWPIVDLENYLGRQESPRRQMSP